MARGAAFSAFEAIGILSATLATLIVLGVVTATLELPLVVSAMVGELALIVVPLFAVRLLGKQLGIAPTAGPFVAGALLIGASGWYLNLRLIELLPIPEGAADHLRRVVERPPLAITLLAIAVLPAVCEEVLFRGVLFRGLATRFVPWVAGVLSAAVFAAYHMNPGQLVPTFLIGLALAWMTWRAQSIVPAMVAHLMNNLWGVLVSRDTPPGLVAVLEARPALTLVVAASLTAAGIAVIAMRKTPEPDAFSR